MDIILIAGLWLDGRIWSEVSDALRAAGHRPIALTLPGQGDGAPDATLADQVAAVVAAVDSASGEDERVVVVGHSAACTLAWAGADARPEKVAAVVLIGGFPAADGQTYADFFEPVDGAVAFPGWEPFAGPDSDDLDEQARGVIEAHATPVPAQVTRGIVTLTDQRRYAVPVVMICPEYSPDDARAWVASGDLPELAAAKSVDYVDIDSGHWPMVSKPQELARLLADVAR